jgi:hypothetical protein
MTRCLYGTSLLSEMGYARCVHFVRIQKVRTVPVSLDSEKFITLGSIDTGGYRDLSCQPTPTCLTKNHHKITRPWKNIFTHVAILHVILHSTNGIGVTKMTYKH